MYEKLVAIDIQTTGLSEQNDEIIELAAVRMDVAQPPSAAHDPQAGAPAAPTEWFHTFARPRQAGLPLRVQRLAGITEADVANAPSEAEAIEEFFSFIGGDVIVGHDVAFELRFIEARTQILPANPVIDVADFARFVVPSADAFDPDTLCRHFSIERNPPFSARANANVTASLWLALIDRTGNLPLAVLAAISTVLEPTRHSLRRVFEQAERDAMPRAFEQPPTLEGVFKDFGPIIRAKPVNNPRVPPQKIDADRICAMFMPGGLLARSLSAYEHRQEQERMAREVCEAYNNGLFLMVEAGTGTGKSLAYLAPSIQWALTNREKVIISTNTKNLQEQLFHKDVPLMRRAFAASGLKGGENGQARHTEGGQARHTEGGEARQTEGGQARHTEGGQAFKCALIKGRGNYLCVRKFVYLLYEMDRELATEDRPFVVPLIAWAAETQTGDIAENAGFMNQFRRDIWARVSTRVGECMGPRCRFGMKCFIRRARALSLNSDIVIANHAVVFSEMGMESPVLPPYQHIVFDEAHNIEDVATEHLARRVAAADIYRIFNRINRPGRDRGGRGLFTNIRFQLASAGRREPVAGTEELGECITSALDIMKEAVGVSAEFFNTVGMVFLKRGEEDRIRYDANLRKPDCWGAVQAAAEALSSQLEQLASKLTAAQEMLSDMPEQVAYRQDFTRSLVVEAAELREIIANLKFLIDASDEKYVFWVEQRRMRDLEHVLCAAPLDIGDVMAEHIYDEKSTVVMSSATLTVEDRFDFMMERVGLSKIADASRRRAVALGTSFDFNRQVLFGLPLFLPEPGDGTGQFVPSFAEMLNELLVATRGRALILFTSYDMLNRTYPLVKERLEGEGILLLGQGIDGERSKITRIFERDVSSVLMGTQSFWEGVDIPGESLSCLVLAKLPFQVHTEPVVQARCEFLAAQGREPFHEYSVPVAVIRLKQGFGRLIRTRTDRGIVIVCDRRLATKAYGARFINSLPGKVRIFAHREEMIKAVEKFLGGGGKSEA